MTEPAPLAHEEASPASLLARVQDLRTAGAGDIDAARLRQLETLAHRLQDQPDAVRRILARRLDEGVRALAERLAQAQEAQASMPRSPGAAARPAAPQRAPLLSQLNRYLQERARESQPAHGVPPLAGAVPEMKSVRRFSELWSRIAAETQVEQAVGRAPLNAGPLNSHMLVLRALTLMRQLSPDYLHRFVSQSEALLWLDQVNQKLALTEAKPPRRGRSKKEAQGR